MYKLKTDLRTLFDEHGLHYSDDELRDFTHRLLQKDDRSEKRIITVYPKGTQLVEKKQWQIWR